MKHYFTLIIAVLTVTTASAQITKGGKVLPKEYTIDTFTKEVTVVIPTQTNTSGQFVSLYYSIANPSSALKALPTVGSDFSDMYRGLEGIGMKTGWRFGIKAQWLLPSINQHMIEELDWGMNYMFEIGSNSYSFDGVEGTGDNWNEANADYTPFWDISLGGLGPNLTYHTPIKGLDIDAFANLGLNMITGGGFVNTKTNQSVENYDGIAMSFYKNYGISVRYSSLYLSLNLKSYNFNNNQYDLYTPGSISKTSVFFSQLPMKFTNITFGVAF